MDMVLCAKTLGRSPGHIVLSIGACMFDRHGKNADLQNHPDYQLYVPISVFSSHDLKLQTDPSTLNWWRKQPVWSTVGQESMECKVTVAQACDQLAQFIERHKPEKIWSNSPTFHIAVVNHLFEKLARPSPIHYRQEMDFRTLMDLVYVDRSDRPQFEGASGYATHHALGDCITQSLQITRAVKDIHPVNALELEKQKWLMLDIETLGRRPGFGIMSIGATVFSACSTQDKLLEPDNQFYSVINNFDMQNCGFKVDAETLKWWRDRSIWPELSNQIMDSPTSVHKACTNLASFLDKQKPDKVWANSPSFDIEMLRAMFKRMRVELPIHYRQEMDFRTVMELAYPDRNLRPGIQLGHTFPPHHALGDAMEQTLQAQMAMEKLGIAPALNNAHQFKNLLGAKRVNKKNKLVPG